jgi:hypothetical protein
MGHNPSRPFVLFVGRITRQKEFLTSFKQSSNEKEAQVVLALVHDTQELAE